MEEKLKLLVKNLMFLEFPVVRLIQEVEQHEILWKKSYSYKLNHEWYKKSKEDFKKDIWQEMGQKLMVEFLQYTPNASEKLRIGRDLQKNWRKIRSIVAQRRRRHVKRPRNLNFDFKCLRFLESDMSIRSASMRSGSKRRSNNNNMAAMVEDDPEEPVEDAGEDPDEDLGEEEYNDVVFDSPPPSIIRPPYKCPFPVTHSRTHIQNLQTHIQEIYQKLLGIPEPSAYDAIGVVHEVINEYVELWND